MLLMLIFLQPKFLLVPPYLVYLLCNGVLQLLLLCLKILLQPLPLQPKFFLVMLLLLQLLCNKPVSLLLLSLVVCWL